MKWESSISKVNHETGKTKDTVESLLRAKFGREAHTDNLQPQDFYVMAAT